MSNKYHQEKIWLKMQLNSNYGVNTIGPSYYTIYSRMNNLHKLTERVELRKVKIKNIIK
jgi:hypothetical protein